MSNLGEKVNKIRSKNAGPFWITIDIFCGRKEVYEVICIKLNNHKVANLLMLNVNDLKRYELEKLNVIKFSFPRNITQGHILDRDMHGAQFAVLLSEMEF